jgi:hypothetical protein
VPDHPIDLSDPTAQEALRKALTGARLAVLDPLRHFLGDADENKAEQVYPRLEPLRRIAVETGCAVLVVHHAVKQRYGSPEDSVRGSGAIRGLTRALLVAHAPRAKDGLTSIKITAENRYMRPAPPFTVVFSEQDGIVDITTGGGVLGDRILAQLAQGQATPSELAEALQADAGTIRTTLNRLKAASQVGPAGKRSRETIWRVSTSRKKGNKSDEDDDDS